MLPISFSASISASPATSSISSVRECTGARGPKGTASADVIASRDPAATGRAQRRIPVRIRREQTQITEGEEKEPRSQIHLQGSERRETAMRIVVSREAEAAHRKTH